MTFRETARFSYNSEHKYGAHRANLEQALTALTMWLRFVTQLSYLNQWVASFVMMMLQIVQDVCVFMIILTFSLVGFAHFFFLLYKCVLVVYYCVLT